MYYIISPVPLSKLKEYHIPMQKENKLMRDLKAFYDTDSGKEFAQIAPLRMSREDSQKNALWNIAMDIAWIGLCYNCPLYVYIMSEKYYHSQLDIGLLRVTNFEKLHNLQTRVSDERLPNSEMYFGGKGPDVVVANVNEAMKVKLTKDRPVIAYKLEKDKIEKIEV